MTMGWKWRCSMVLLAACLAACTGSGIRLQKPEGEWSWPAENPHLRLESVLDLETRTARRPSPWGSAASTGPNAGRFARPHGITWVGDDLVITDPEAGRVYRITPDGGLQGSSPGLFQSPVGVAVCPSGLAVSDPPAGRLALLDDQLRLIRWLAEDLERPTGVACTDNEIWVVETGAHRLRVLSPGGMSRQFGTRGSGPDEFNFPTAVALAGEHALVGDTLNFRVQRLERSTGRNVSSFGQLGDNPGQTPRIKDVAVDAAGHIWVTDAHLDTVSLFTMDGTLLLSLGGRGQGPAEFSFPAGLAAHEDGRVAVVDAFNRRIQIFRILDAGNG